jgi:hypothetical protein
MRSSLLFTTFDPVLETPAICSGCGVSLPIFHYEFQSEDGKGEPCQRNGFCCEPCARRFLKALECTESQQWAEEEEGLANSDSDTAEFHKRLESLRSVLVG